MSSKQQSMRKAMGYYSYTYILLDESTLVDRRDSSTLLEKANSHVVNFLWRGPHGEECGQPLNSLQLVMKMRPSVTELQEMNFRNQKELISRFLACRRECSPADTFGTPGEILNRGPS